MNVVRGILTDLTDDQVRIFSSTGRPGESFSQREFLQHYGFRSRPKAGAGLIIMVDGNVITCIGSDDRRYVLDLADGEVALHDWQGQKVHLKDGKEIEISGCDTLVATCGVSASITAPTVTVTATTKVILDTPLVEAKHDMKIDGKLDVTADITSTDGNIAATAGNVSDQTRSMAGDRTIYNGHEHHPTALYPPTALM